jgi:AcrR family transcriptional regulator/DNA-binding HxlR family transcriptional regulator
MSLPPPEDERVPMRRAGVPGPQGGGVYLSRVQHTRLLDAALAVVAEEGVKRLSATRVAGYAGMSSKTFYDLFADSEDCFLAVFSRAVDGLAAVAAPAWTVEGEWHERVRAALTALLGCLEREPALGKVVFLEALGAGPRVLARRVEVLDRVAGFIDEGREGSPLAGVLPALTAAGVVGAAFSVIHARLSQGAHKPQEPGSSLLDLVSPVMATIVLPYRGQEASARELERPVPELPEPAVSPESAEDASPDSRERGASRSKMNGPANPSWRTDRRSTGSPIGQHASDRGRRDGPPIDSVRPTKRTYMVLASVAELGGASNREIGEGAEISDPAQISKMLSRLEEHGLVENRGGRTPGFAKAWWLTAPGEEFLREGLSAGPGGTPAVGRVRPVRRGRPARAGRAGAARELKRGGALVRRTGTDTAERRRVRMLRAAVAMADEHGYANLTVAHIAGRAKISRRTFYEVFEDREACLLAVLEDIDAQLTTELHAADLDRLPWRERVRLGLWMVLRFFDREPGLARFCVVHSARGDERIAAYREQLLARIAGVIAEGRQESAKGGQESVLGECSPLVAEGLAGAIVSILNTRLSISGRRAAGRPRKDVPASGPLSDLFGELMGLIVLPYLGPEVAQEERARPAPADPVPASLPVPAPGSKQGGKYLALDPDPSPVPGLRMTYRTALVLEAIARAPGISNLGVARHAQINDQGQISKLLARLERNGLVQNTGRGQTQGAPNEWRLTPAGQKLEQDIRERARTNEKQAA